VATLDRATFFHQESNTGEATLEFERRPSPERDEFRIQYTEPGTPWAYGWHQDGTHENLGPSHFQVDHKAWVAPHRGSASFIDPNPMATIETSLNELREHVHLSRMLLSAHTASTGLFSQRGELVALAFKTLSWRLLPLCCSYTVEK